MTSDVTSASGRVLRAGLILPVLAGVIAMHVLLLCSDGGGARSHDGHASSAAGSLHVMQSGHAVTPATASGGVGAAPEVVVAERHPAAGLPPHGLALCLAVLVVAVAIGFRGRAGASRVRAVRRGMRLPALVAVARPPPSLPLGVLLCVSRT